MVCFSELGGDGRKGAAGAGGGGDRCGHHAADVGASKTTGLGGVGSRRGHQGRHGHREGHADSKYAAHTAFS